jgi:hypothetical protein
MSECLLGRLGIFLFRYGLVAAAVGVSLPWEFVVGVERPVPTLFGWVSGVLFVAVAALVAEWLPMKALLRLIREFPGEMPDWIADNAGADR